MIWAKKLYPAFMAMGITLCIYLYTSDSAAADPPKAVFEKTAFNFKEVLEGEIVEHAYSVRNSGKSPLVIKSVRTSCGCTTAKRPDTIAPGESDQIVVKGNTSGYGGHRFEKVILVSTNDPGQKEIRLTLEGTVERFADIKPRMINLHGNVGEDLVKEVKIAPNAKYPFKILAVKPDDNLKGKIDLKLEENKGGYTINVHNKVAGETRYRGQVIVETDSPKKSRIELYVYCNVRKKPS